MTTIIEKKCKVCGRTIFGKSDKQAVYNLKVHTKACNRKRKKVEDRIKILKSKS